MNLDLVVLIAILNQCQVGRRELMINLLLSLEKRDTYIYVCVCVCVWLVFDIWNSNNTLNDGVSSGINTFVYAYCSFPAVNGQIMVT